MKLGSRLPLPPIDLRQCLILVVIGIAAFHLAYAFVACRFGMVIFLFCLLRLACLPTPRKGFYGGLLIGLAIYGPQLGFFWSVFGFPAVTLWTVLAFWIGLFVLLLHLCQRQLGTLWAAALIPFLWTGLEYFRSEVYYLRFSWLNIGFAFSEPPSRYLACTLGVYGIGFVLATVAALLSWLPWRTMAVASVLALPAMALLDTQTDRQAFDHQQSSNQLTVAGVQMEFPVELEVPGLLDKALAQCPKAELFMLSEYTFDGPVPKRVRDWCRKNKRYLLAGGKDIVGSPDFYDTAFVIGPSGDVVFQQAKSVPIQFFKDGFPAKKQQVWSSPWGKLGICICYDLSYSRVTEALVRQGAQALLVPTMDVIEWGKHEHELHSRIGPFRAAEYRLPILRVASSGVSQLIDKSGTITCSAPFPQQGQVISGDLNLPMRGQLPLDRYLAPFATGVTGVLIGWLVASSIWSKRVGSQPRLPVAEKANGCHSPSR